MAECEVSRLGPPEVVKPDFAELVRVMIQFSHGCHCPFDSLLNKVNNDDNLTAYIDSFDFPVAAELLLIGDSTVWNPPPNKVVINSTMLCYGVTLPFQPFIYRFVGQLRLSPFQLSPTCYCILMCMCVLWQSNGLPPHTFCKKLHFYQM